MKVKLNIKGIANAVNHSICGLTPNSLTPDSISITTIYNGSVVETIIAPAITYTLTIPTLNFFDKAQVFIEVNKTDYNRFAQVFEVYGYDLGYFDSGSCNNTTAFDIVMIKEDYRTTNERNPEHEDYIPYKLKLAYSSFIGLREPLTKNLHLYTTNSSDGAVVYTNEMDETLSTIIANCSEQIVKQTITTYIDSSDCGCGFQGGGVLDTCEGSEDTYIEWNFVPKLHENINSSVCDNNCFTTESTNKTSVQYDLMEITPLYIDGTLQAPVKLFQIIQELYGAGAEIVDGVITTIVTDGLTVLFEAGDKIDASSSYATVEDADYGLGHIVFYDWSFDTPSIGDYVLKTSFEILDTTLETVLSCPQQFSIKVENWFKIVDKDVCNEKDLYNYASEEVSVEVYKLNAEGDFELQITEAINPCSIKTLTLVSDGVYRLSVSRPSLEGLFEEITISYCNLERCWLLYNKSIICDVQDQCEPRDVYLYVSMGTLIQVLFTKINAYLNFGTYFDVLSKTEIDDLFDIQVLIDRINNDYCDTCVNQTINKSTLYFSSTCQLCENA